MGLHHAVSKFHVFFWQPYATQVIFFFFLMASPSLVLPSFSIKLLIEEIISEYICSGIFSSSYFKKVLSMNLAKSKSWMKKPLWKHLCFHHPRANSTHIMIVLRIHWFPNLRQYFYEYSKRVCCRVCIDSVAILFALSFFSLSPAPTPDPQSQISQLPGAAPSSRGK